MKNLTALLLIAAALTPFLSTPHLAAAPAAPSDEATALGLDTDSQPAAPATKAKGGKKAKAAKSTTAQQLGPNDLAKAALEAEAANATDTFTRLPDRPADLANDRNLYLVGYSHLDTQWRWAYPVTIRDFIANTLNDNFKLFEKYPNYTLNFCGSRRYQMMQDYYPAEFERARAYIKSGRWFPAGSSVDETDTLAPNAESLIRNVLYGNEYFRREFGVASDEYMLPDCFGFSYSMPTILAHCGVKGFSTQKLSWGSAVGIPFKVGNWIGPDGSSIIAALDPDKYTGRVTEDLSQNKTWLARIQATGSTSGAYVDYHYYGIGDRGGAPNAGSVLWVERSLVNAGKGPIRVISSAAADMFNDLLKQPDKVAKLPSYQGELLLTEHSAGSLTSQSFMKRMNRKNEQLANAAETAAVAAHWLGAGDYATQKIHDAWQLVLGSQFHDILPGTSIPPAYEFSWNDEILAANLFASVLESSVGAVASAMDTRAKDANSVALVIYNPLSIAREDVVEAMIPTIPTTIDPAHLTSFPHYAATGPDGAEIPVQIVGGAGNKTKIAFLAAVAPVSFSVFEIHQTTEANSSSQLTVTKNSLENAIYRVTIAPSGDVTSIFDKSAKRELLAGPAQLEFLHEKPQKFPAWNMDWNDRQKTVRAVVGGPAKITVVENGPVRAAVRIEREAEGSKFVQTIRLVGGAGAAGTNVEFATEIDWHTPESSLKAAFKLATPNPLATYDLQVGTTQRGNNNEVKYEVPQQQWFDVTATDSSFGVSILNDSKYGSDKPTDDTVRLTLLYTPGVRDRFQDEATQDFGHHEMLYAVASHGYSWSCQGSQSIPEKAARLNQPLRAFTTSQHAGDLGKSFSLFHTDQGNMAITAIKKAENSDEIIVRYRELGGKPRDMVNLRAAAEFDGCFTVSKMVNIVAAREVDGQERAIKGDAKLENGRLAFAIPAYALKSFAIKLAPPPATAAKITAQQIPLAYDEDVISTNANRADGSFDTEGRAYAAEQFPATLTSENIPFTLGPTADGQKNALAARGQTISLPAGTHNRLYLLAAADGDRPACLAIDGKPATLTIQNWTGFIGQWDNRIWDKEQPEVAYNWDAKMTGLTPAYTKRDTVATYAQHRHTPKSDDPYRYTYLFKYALDLPPGAKTLTLPNDPRIRIFAITIADDPQNQVRAAAPLYDTLERDAAN